MNDFADIFKYLRLRDGLSQRELAKRLKISPSAVAMYESGKRFPSREAEEQIADFFNVSIDLLRGKEAEIFTVDNDLVREFSSYSEAFQRRLLSYAKFIIKEEGENKND